MLWPFFTTPDSSRTPRAFMLMPPLVYLLSFQHTNLFPTSFVCLSLFLCEYFSIAPSWLVVLISNATFSDGLPWSSNIKEPLANSTGNSPNHLCFYCLYRFHYSGYSFCIFVYLLSNNSGSLWGGTSKPLLYEQHPGQCLQQSIYRLSI